MKNKDICPNCSDNSLYEYKNNKYKCYNCEYSEKQDLGEYFNYKNYKNTTTKIINHRSIKEKQNKNKMITETKGEYTNYKPSKDFKCVCLSAYPYKSAPKQITLTKGKDAGKVKTIHNYGVYIKNPENEEDKIFLTLTYSLWDMLEKACNNDTLENKTLHFEERTHSEYTNLLKVSVL